MTIDELSPTATLLVVDVQAGTLPNARAIDGDVLVDRIARLATAFRASHRPVVFAVSTGTPPGRTEHGSGGRTWAAGFAELDPRLERRTTEPVLERAAWSAFAGTPLAQILADASSTELVIVGLATTFGVESTARNAADAGLDVIVVSDAVSDPDPEGHTRSVTRVFPALGRVVASEEILG